MWTSIITTVPSWQSRLAANNGYARQQNRGVKPTRLPLPCRVAARGGSVGTLYPSARSQGEQETGRNFQFLGDLPRAPHRLAAALLSCVNRRLRRQCNIDRTLLPYSWFASLTFDFLSFDSYKFSVQFSVQQKNEQGKKRTSFHNFHLFRAKHHNLSRDRCDEITSVSSDSTYIYGLCLIFSILNLC